MIISQLRYIEEKHSRKYMLCCVYYFYAVIMRHALIATYWYSLEGKNNRYQTATFR